MTNVHLDASNASDVTDDGEHDPGKEVRVSFANHQDDGNEELASATHVATEEHESNDSATEDLANAQALANTVEPALEKQSRYTEPWSNEPQRLGKCNAWQITCLLIDILATLLSMFFLGSANLFSCMLIPYHLFPSSATYHKLTSIRWWNSLWAARA